MDFAETLGQQQALLKTELDVANSTLIDSLEHLKTVEDKLQRAFNENCQIKEKQQVNQKLWQELESKFSATNAVCRSALALENKDATIKSLEADVVAYKMSSESLKSNLEDAREELRQKEEDITQMKVSLDKLRNENANIHSANENVKLIKELEEKAGNLSESLKSSQDKMEELLLKLSELESENKDKAEKLQACALNDANQIVLLDSLAKQVNQLSNDLKQKEQLIMEYKEREKCLKNRMAEIQALLVTAESKFSDAEEQYGSMLEEHKLQLSNHLKELAQKNDKGSPYPAEQSPMATLLMKFGNANSAMIDISNHSKKVTRREYEVETNNAGKITKRQKTNTVLMGTRKHKKAVALSSSTPRQSTKGYTGGALTQPFNIFGDLLTEGSLNPYAVDDPYTFTEG